METLNSILNILGFLGFVLAAILSWIQIRSLFHPLQLYITYYDCQPTDNESALILLRVSFVNPSSQSRTICHLDIKDRTDGQHLIEVKREDKLNLHTVTYSLSNVSRQFPSEEILQLPLDIPPNQSLSKWVAIGIDAHTDYEHKEYRMGIPIQLAACNPVGKHKFVQTSETSWEKTDLQRKVLAHFEYIVFPCIQQSRHVNIFREGGI